ncbi:ribonuclease H-like domain-containing protein, partial [Tanacetum coccineum]
YNAVAPPPTGLFAPPTIDLSNSSLEEFKQPEFDGYRVKVKKNVSENSSNEIKKTSGAPIIEDWGSDSNEDETMENVSESANVQKPEQADQPRKVSQNPRNNSTNQNTPMSMKLGVGFQFIPKACFVCGRKLDQFEKGDWSKGSLTKSGLVPISTTRQSSTRTAATVSTARPIKTDAPKPFVNIAKSRPNAFQKVTSAVGEQGINAVKSSACWGDSQVALKDTGIFDSGCSGYMTGNKSYLTNYQDYDGGFMCDRKNSVIFTKTECLILSPDFKLHDENQVMLKIPRKDNMYSFDLKNIVPSKGLTCLFVKATNDESKLWHQRLGHINFKTLNKLVKGNLVWYKAVPMKEMGDRYWKWLSLTASSFEAEQDSERKEADDIDWSKIIEQAQERQSGSMIMYHALKKKLVTVAQASGSEPFQEQSTKEPKELSEEDLTEILEIVLVEETKDRKLQVEEDSQVARDLVMKIFIEANKPRS